ncbi:isoleucine--tRNA ligase-like [Macrosteles quadrilineatus]|uniref:isoleucine--tRNA ligase-like n=1 Tax=Macrosteles quadrilineatus TaxID=74068 RepID=UPI0023E24CE8|nr:isoleucine--tRNA ligase-like [Macrosteles quadrilineatus]
MFIMSRNQDVPLWMLLVYINLNLQAPGHTVLALYYPQTESDVDFSKQEKGIRTFWEENNIFFKSVDQRSEENRYVVYDGPPFANGRPHYGHLLTGFIKDTYSRYQTMLGKRVERWLGWDCHGLPAEMEAEKSLNISGKTKIEEFGIAKFNKRCKDEVIKFMSAWENYIIMQGRWVDFSHSYLTMNRRFMESVMWAFKQLYKKGLIYESERVVPYSWACQSPLSNFETKLDNSYRIKTSKSVTVAFELLEKPTRLENLAPPCKLLVWTTTPWTLPSNLALAVGRNITYIVIWVQPSYGRKTEHCLYIFAKQYLSKFLEVISKKKVDTVNLDMEFSYKDLINLPYKPLFPYFDQIEGAFKILDSGHVSAEEGTGVVHIAPGFGEDDFNLCKKKNISVVCPVDEAGKFTDEVWDFNKTQVFDAESAIIKHLKAHKNVFHTEAYSHSYPHCWRTDTPLIYRTMPSWYVAVTKLKNRMIELNKNVNWVPEHIKDGMFGKWIEGADDWSISRNRFWGTPIPVWKSDNAAFPRIDVYGSIEEMEHDFGKKIQDLHRPHIDCLTRPNPDDPSGNSTMRRIPDIFDCWFESGSMPFAQYHYPFENEDKFKTNFPAHFIAEYMAQTRGWFYTLFILSTALFNEAPFKNSICHGVVLDSKGCKLSKRLDNFCDPSVMIVEYGSDALRFMMLSRPVVMGENLNIDKKGKSIQDVVRLIIKPIWNTYNFFTLYANADVIKANVSNNPLHYEKTIDKYIMFKCFQAVSKIKKSMDNYDSQKACKVVYEFFEILNNWYIRRNRERFWSKEHDKNKLDAYNALYTVLNYILRATAPLLPHVTDVIWQGLRFNESSIHLTDFPYIPVHESDNISAEMDFTRNICNAAMSARKQCKVRVRQPLRTLRIYHESLIDSLEEENTVAIKEEANVKEIEWRANYEGLAETHLQLKFPVIGKRVPDKIKRIIQLLGEHKWRRAGCNVIIGEGAEEYQIHSNEYDLKLKPIGNACVFDNGKGVLSYDLELDEELKLEGHARDVVRNIQETRKQADLDISDKIWVVIKTSDMEIKKAICKWMDYIKEQTLAHSLEVKEAITQDLFSREYDKLTVAIRVYHDLM